MKICNSLLAAVVALICLFGGFAASASADPASIPTVSARHCGIHYKLTRDLNGHWYCKFAPDPNHRRGNGNNRHSGS